MKQFLPTAILTLAMIIFCSGSVMAAWFDDSPEDVVEKYLEAADYHERLEFVIPEPDIERAMAKVYGDMVFNTSKIETKNVDCPKKVKPSVRCMVSATWQFEHRGKFRKGTGDYVIEFDENENPKIDWRQSTGSNKIGLANLLRDEPLGQHTVWGRAYFDNYFNYGFMNKRIRFIL